MIHEISSLQTRLFFFRCLISLSMLVLAACTGAAVEINGEITEEIFPTEVINESPEPTSPQETGGAIVPAEKPSLSMENLAGLELNSPAVGFVFADGFTPFKVAPVAGTQYLSEEGLTILAVIDVGDGGDFLGGGHYLVGVDTQTDSDFVTGIIYFPDGTPVLDLGFHRQKMVLNPERTSESNIPAYRIETVPPVSVGIQADTMCFVVAETQTVYWRYCAESDSALSTRASYPFQYFEQEGNPIQTMDATVLRLIEKEYLDDSVQIEFDLAIMELEARSNIRGCVNNGECGADIAGAPITTFWEDFSSAWDQAGGENFYVAAAALRVFRPIDLENEAADVVMPGDYVVWFQFDPNGQFLGAELWGIDDQENSVSGQRIPAVPSTFVPADGRPGIVSQISAWKVVGWCCFWQKKCS